MLAGWRVPCTFLALAGPVRLPMVRILCANADDAGLATGFRAFAAIAEKQISAARRAERAGGDVARGHARIEKLPAGGGAQVELYSLGRRIVSRGRPA